MKLFNPKELLLFNQSSINIENTLMFLICVISSMAIYASDTTLSTKSVQTALVSFVYIAVIVVGFRLISRKSLKFSQLLLSPIIYVLICYFNSPDSNFNLLLLLDLLLFLSLSDDSKTFIYLLFRKYMVVMSMLGIIAYAAYYLSLPIPYDTVSYYSEYSSSVYLNYHFSYLVVSFPYVRLCGLFNEPGYFGTIAAFILCIERMNLRNKGNLIIFLASIFTFSVAFYVIVFVYAVLMARKNKVVLATLLLLSIFVFYVMPYIDMGASFDRLTERLTFTDGKLAGDNRSKGDIDDFVIRMIGTSKMFWGYGRTSKQGRLEHKNDVRLC